MTRGIPTRWLGPCTPNHPAFTYNHRLANYTGRSLSNLVAPPSEDGVQTERYVFRLIGSRVYYLPLKLANLAVSIPRDNLLSVGTMIGRFTKTKKFRLNLTALDVIAPHARYRVWVRANGESEIHRAKGSCGYSLTVA